MTIVLVTFAGGLGAMVRWLVDLLAAARFGRRLPWGTITVNVVGSTVAGALAGATLAAHLGGQATQVAAIGFCGGLTTFSAASFDVARELERRRYGLGAMLFVAPMALAVLAGGIAFGLAGG